MAKCFTSWTVLPHDPIEKHADNLWSVSGKMPGGNQRRMTVARRSDGQLVIHNAMALTNDEMKELEGFGKPSFLIVPNNWHRMDALIYKQRYPQLTVLSPRASRKKISDVVEVDGHLDELPKDENVELFHLRGMNEREGALRVKSNGTSALVFNDVLLNVPQQGGFMGFLLGPTGTLSLPRVTRWMMLKDAAALKEHLQELAKTPGLAQLVPGHGDVVQRDVVGGLQAAIARF